MVRRTEFVIRNDFARPLTLNIEPEGAFYHLGAGQEVNVLDSFVTAPVTVVLSASDIGDPILSLWPGDGTMTVQKGGVDLLELIQHEANADVHASPNGR